MTTGGTEHHGGNLRRLAEKAGLPRESLLDFSANINPLGPPENLRPVISRTLEEVVHYPDPQSVELAEAVGRAFALHPDHVVLGNGSTELIFALPRVLGMTRAVIPAPCYVDYSRAAEMGGLEVEFFPMPEEQGFVLDCQALQARIRSKDLVIVGLPNNPTGLCPDLEALHALAGNNPEAFFLLDEAFADFVPGLGTGFDPGLDNLAVVRSMTKFYAIPGLRLGFGLFSKPLASLVREQVPPWSVNVLAQAVGVSVLGRHEYADRSRALVATARHGLQRSLEQLPGLRVFPGQANYLFGQVTSGSMSARCLAEKLLKDHGIAIRVCDNYHGLDERFFRVAVKTGRENEHLVSALSSALGGPMSGRIRARPGKKKRPALMFQGTSSNAGKSVLVSALCRILLQDGLRVAPFKAQNMSLNSYVTRDGREMGRAQVVQAQASRLDPEVRMNPVLIKPSSDVGSQIIVDGRPVRNMSVADYITYKPRAWEAVCRAYDSLARDFDVLVLEGAGSPGEVNLKHHDIVNMRMADYAGASVVLVGDIDRGGVFASFIGTMEVLAEWERRLVAGFCINRFRGDPSLLAEALDYTTGFTRRPVFGTVPYLHDLGLPEEDSVSFKSGFFSKGRHDSQEVEVALIDLDHISNFTDFEPFLGEPDVSLTVVKPGQDLGCPDAVLIPGSKNVIHDLTRLIQSGVGPQILELAAAGRAEIVGICGGYQMLGRTIRDPYGLESSGGGMDGLGLLPMSTVLEKEKTLTLCKGVHLESGQPVQGYEIHHGQDQVPALRPVIKLEDGTLAGAASDGLVWGVYWHGVFDSDGFRRWFIDRLRIRKGLPAKGEICCRYDIEPALDRLAGVVRQSLDMEAIYRLLKV